MHVKPDAGSVPVHAYNVHSADFDCDDDEAIGSVQHGRQSQTKVERKKIGSLNAGVAYGSLSVPASARAEVFEFYADDERLVKVVAIVGRVHGGFAAASVVDGRVVERTGLTRFAAMNRLSADVGDMLAENNKSRMLVSVAGVRAAAVHNGG